VLKTNLPEIHALVAKMLKTEDFEKMYGLLAKLNSV